MALTLIIGLVLLAVGVLIGVIVWFTVGAGAGSGSDMAVSNNLRTLVTAQRVQPGEKRREQDRRGELALAAAAESQFSRKQAQESTRMTVAKRLHYARWVITPVQFRSIQSLVGIALFVPAYLHATVFIMLLSAVMGPVVVSGMLDYCVRRRFSLFDQDYPVMLLQYVSLLKTGLNTISGLESAAKGLEEGSLVRAEMELLMERLKMGLTEDQAISAFGEDIPHPELELFVQSLLLSRRVGGALSNTLDRLAKQVRKRQQFRKQAVAAVGMERSSLHMIALIMTCLMFYLAYTAPELVFPAFQSKMGNKIFQFGLMLIVFGFYWSRRVTNIKA